MPKEDYDTSPMVMTFYTQKFEEIDYSIPLNSPFDVTAPLQAMLLEAQAKHCAIIVNVALISLDDFYGPQTEEPEGEPNEE